MAREFQLFQIFQLFQFQLIIKEYYTSLNTI